MSHHPDCSIDEFRRLTGQAAPHKPQESRDAIHFVVPGEPMGKPRMTRRDKWKQRPCIVKYRRWADLARDHAGCLPEPHRIARLDWRAVFVPPASWSDKKRAAALGQPHRSRPDRDNIDKAILDALFKSDAGIACGTISKVWGPVPMLEVWIVLQ